MYTSYYTNIRNIPANLRPVAISRSVPKWFNGSADQRLAPTWAMLHMSREEYDYEFRKILKRLNPRKIYEDLGDNAVLLCYERPNEWCHRRLVAEWFEEHLGIVVPEWGLPREKTLPYEMCGREPRPELERNPEPVPAQKPEGKQTEVEFEQMELRLW